jgi:hypothetical protein
MISKKTERVIISPMAFIGSPLVAGLAAEIACVIEWAAGS